MSHTALNQSDSSAPERKKLAAVVDFMAAKHRHTAGTQTTYFLSSSEGDERVELTPELYEVLRDAAHALQRGTSVTAHRSDREITTQQAADLLGISRPTVVRLIDDGSLAATVPGVRRRKLQLADVLRYRDQLREERNRFITESSLAYEDHSADDVHSALAEVRHRR